MTFLVAFTVGVHVAAAVAVVELFGAGPRRAYGHNARWSRCVSCGHDVMSKVRVRVFVCPQATQHGRQQPPPAAGP